MVRRTLQQIGREARRFRRKHGAGAHLPTSLRKAAALLAVNDDAEAVARELEIGRGTLRRWGIRYPAVAVAAASPRPAAKAAVKAKPKKIDFVEIKGTTPRQVVRPESSSSVVEVTRPDGWTVRVTGDLAKGLVAATLAKLTR